MTWINIYVIIKQKWDFNKDLKKSIKNKKSPWQKIKSMIYLIHNKEGGKKYEVTAKKIKKVLTKF